MNRLKTIEMKKHRGFRIAVMVCLGLGIAALLALAVMLLWNWLIPAIFAGGPEITYWQALGLMVLAKILFGGFKPHPPPVCGTSNRDFWKEKMRKKWENMDPAKRERIRNNMFSRFHGFPQEDEATSTEVDKPEEEKEG